MSTLQKQKPPRGQIALFQVSEVPNQYRKAVQVLHSKPTKQLTLLQRKIMNSWLKNAVDTKPNENGWWTIPIATVLKDLDFNSHNRDHLKQSALELMSVVFEWDLLASEDRRVNWKASVLFPEVESDDRFIRYQISSQMLSVVKEPSIYALIDLNIQNKFKRATSVALYEFCFRYEKLKATKAVGWTVLRDMMVGGSSSYKEYKYFKAKVLKHAIFEINTHSNISIELIEHKLGRVVQDLEFTVERKKLDLPVSEIQNEDQLNLVGQMGELGVPQSEAKKLLTKFDQPLLVGAIDYTRKRMADTTSGELENPGAYFRAALNNGWGAPVEVKPAKSDQRKNDFNSKLLERYNLSQQSEAEKYFNELNKEDQSILMDRYNQQQEVASLKVKTKATKASKVAFFQWLAIDTWGQPTQEDLLNFATALLRERL